jgi:hypothetical protein
MSGIKQPIQDILAKLSTIQVANQDHQTVNLYSRVWNNQVANIKDGKSYEWPRPAAFVEVVSPARFEILGMGLRSADLGIRVHLVHDNYNNESAGFDQDLAIFDLRDIILGNFDNPVNPGLSNYCPTACGPLVCVGEDQDYDHDNLYHYILEFVCNFIDSKGSPYDPNTGKYFDTPNPDLEMTVEKDGIPTKPSEEITFIIPQ